MNTFQAQNVKLIACDLDDTLQDRSFILSPYTIDIIHRVQEKGTKFIVASGRTFPSCATYSRILNSPGPVISMQGALVKSLEEKLSIAQVSLLQQ
jgi:HAD superfamily hydrolase (TIGR01484 family)